MRQQQRLAVCMPLNAHTHAWLCLEGGACTSGGWAQQQQHACGCITGPLGRIVCTPPTHHAWGRGMASSSLRPAEPPDTVRPTQCCCLRSHMHAPPPPTNARRRCHRPGCSTPPVMSLATPPPSPIPPPHLALLPKVGLRHVLHEALDDTRLAGLDVLWARPTCSATQGGAAQCVTHVPQRVLASLLRAACAVCAGGP